MTSRDFRISLVTPILQLVHSGRRSQTFDFFRRFFPASSSKLWNKSGAIFPELRRIHSQLESYCVVIRADNKFYSETHSLRLSLDFSKWTI